MTNTVASIIIPTRNKASYLELTLASLARQSVPCGTWEVIVTDDESTDNTSSILDQCERDGRLRLKRQKSSRCRGRSGARNDALEIAEGSVCVFLDDDRIVGRDFLLYHLMHHVGPPRIVMGDVHKGIHTHISPSLNPKMWTLMRTLSRENQEPPDSDALIRVVEAEDLDCPERLDALTVAYSIELRQVVEIYDRAGIDYPPPWIYFTTGNASVPMACIRDIGGFDEKFSGWGLEDNDIAYRLAANGVGFWLEPRAYSLHQVHRSDWDKAVTHERNLKYFLHKHPSTNYPEVELQLRGAMEMSQWIEYQHRIKHRNSRSVEAASKNPMLLWCLPGNGMEQARRSVAVVRELQTLRPELTLRFVTSGAVATWLRYYGYDVEDLGIHSQKSPWHRFEGYMNRLKKYRPNLLISDEDLLALPVARALDVPCVYLTSLMLDERQHPDATYASCANRILFADLPGSFLIPPNQFGKVDFCGPWIMPVSDEPDEWHTLLNHEEGLLVAVSLGNGHPSDAEFVRHCIEAAGAVSARLVILAGALTDRLLASGPFPAPVTILESVPDRMQLFRNADIVIARGEHTLLWELAAAGLPTIVVPRPQEEDIKATACALRMAEFGSCHYIPGESISSDSLQAAFAQIQEEAVGNQLRSAARNIDFAALLRQAADHILDTLDA